MENQKSPAPAPLRMWVACCRTQQCWKGLPVPALDIAEDILSVLWVVAAVVLGTLGTQVLGTWFTSALTWTKQPNLWTTAILLS